METFVAYLGAVIPTFLLVLSRTMGLMLQAPILSNKNLPAPVKMSIAFSLSIVVMMLLMSCRTSIESLQKRSFWTRRVGPATFFTSPWRR